MTDPIEGQCLCGAISYQVSEPFNMTADCFCTDCQKSSGTGHGTHAITNEAHFTLTGTTKSYEKKVDSGNQVTRHFCGTCGTGLYSTNTGMPGMIAVRASSLTDLENAKPAVSVYTSRAPSWDQPRTEMKFEEMPPR